MGIVISGQSNYGQIRTARDSHVSNLISIIRTATTTATILGSSSRMVPSAHATTLPTQVLVELNSVEVAAELILTHCTTMLSAARTTGRLLYRGEPVFLTQGISSSSVSSSSTVINSSSVATSLSAMVEKCPLLLSAPPDLLDSNTYTNPAAADFFQTISTALEQQQDQQQSDKNGAYGKYVATPRNGHLATPDILEASKWGPVVSVWPLDSLYYTILSTGRQCIGSAHPGVS